MKINIRGCGLDSVGAVTVSCEQSGAVTVSCEHGDEPSVSVKWLATTR
jgi:hypothetical protein